MRSLQRPLRHKVTDAWQILFFLAALSFLCRALIPAGYMPDFSGAREGKFSITICTATGTNTILVDANGELVEPSSGDYPDNQDCAFCLVASQTLMPAPEMPALAVFLTSRPVSLPHANHALPPLPAQGPPLGSRAPPLNLG
ncbi:DUF2946 family protein [Advenella sp. WQ 585]|uniref:DUF2946 family protein n=1 Tax=Advenella mandrilli TaxID=2800330 RepID=A0ABS1EGR2_9BURK|nr:DUF2946 family protein [Advenella mandrilli]MBK1782200.1 DUF2946 family protein [Advenella mandrilli]MDY0273690.1 DUF2946 family protein [Advenella sp.]